MATEYEVRIAGGRVESWAEWFPGVRVQEGSEPDGSGSTVLRVPGRDVSLLHGVLAQVGALNLILLSVTQIHRRAE
jgi:hypothetical protein